MFTCIQCVCFVVNCLLHLAGRDSYIPSIDIFHGNKHFFNNVPSSISHSSTMLIEQAIVFKEQLS